MHPHIIIRHTFNQLVSGLSVFISLTRKLTQRRSSAFFFSFALLLLIVNVFHRSTIPEEKWGTTRSLHLFCLLFNLGFNNFYTQHAELMEARRDLLKFQRTEQELIRELDDAHALLSTKEADCTRLAKELGAAQVREAQAEAKCVHEVRKAQQQHELKQATQEHEVSELRLLGTS